MNLYKYTNNTILYKLCSTNDIVEAHCYFVDIGRTDREQIRQFCTQLTKAFVAETSCNHCY